MDRNFVCHIALDNPDFAKGLDVVRATHDIVDGFKVHGSAEDSLKEKSERLRKAGAKKIWWDRKACDTPDTVAIIAKTARRCDVDRLTVHAGGGIEMMMAAVAHGPKEIIAIADLTSLTEAEIGHYSGRPKDASVLAKARDAKLAGVGYLVCSGKEVGMLNERRGFSSPADRKLELDGMKFIVPGSRTLDPGNTGSQKRSLTAMETLAAGADELVIGSEITKAADPRAALEQLYMMIAN